MSTYSESAKGVVITWERARAEVRAHSANFQMFLNEVGNLREYDAYEVLEWLGY